MKIHRICGALFALAIGCTFVLGQETRALLTGTVTDPQGAAGARRPVYYQSLVSLRAAKILGRQIHGATAQATSSSSTPLERQKDGLT
jgi:hypothetical protein